MTQRSDTPRIEPASTRREEHPVEIDEVEVDGEITRTLYVQRHGTTIRHRRGTFAVTSDDTELLAVPADLVDAVVCIGSVALTADARHELLERRVHTTFLATSGRLMGSLRPSASVDAERLRAQITAADDAAFATAMARHFVDGKIANMAALLARLDGDPTELDQLRNSTARSERVEQLLGNEGAASAAYFRRWPELLPAWCNFTTRRRRPPPDPVNAALGFGYSLLAGAVEGAVVAAGLEPCIGFLHADDGNRPSLALDLMEEFRPLLVDQVVLEAFRKPSLTPEHFEPGNEAGSIFLTADGRRRMIDSFEQRLHQPFHYRPLARTVNYQRAIFLQAHQVSIAVRRMQPDYQAIAWRR